MDTHSGRAAERRLRRALVRAVDGFGLIGKGDRVLVALSGGKDSFSLLELLLWLRRRRGGFGLEAVFVDHGFGGDAAENTGRFAADRGVPIHRERTAIARLLGEKLAAGRNPCPLCARLRRGALYGLSRRLDFPSIALGHQADDLIETLWLNLLFTGQLKSMPAKLRSDDGRHTVIRPLALAWESDTRLYAAWKGFPVGDFRCPARDGRLDSQRRTVKEIIRRLEASRPGTKLSLLRSLQRVEVGSLLDTRLLGR